MITPVILTGGATFVVPEPAVLTGALLSSADADPADLRLNGNKIAVLTAATNGQTAFVPLKITLKTGDRLNNAQGGIISLYFS